MNVVDTSFVCLSALSARSSEKKVWERVLLVFGQDLVVLCGHQSPLSDTLNRYVAH